MSINKERITTPKSTHKNLVGSPPLSSITVLVKGIGEAIQSFSGRADKLDKNGF